MTGISTSQARLCHPEPSRLSQEKELSAVTSGGEGMHVDITIPSESRRVVDSSRTALPPISGAWPLLHGDPARDTSAAQPKKRHRDGASANDLSPAKRARLTRENLALFNEMPRKKGTNKAESTVESSFTKTTSSTTSGFAIQARENGILEPRRSKPPANLEDIRKRHARSRETTSPPESAYKRYVNRVEGAANEATMVYQAGRKLLKDYDDGDGGDDGYQVALSQSFTGFPKDVGFNIGLSAPQPDFVEGLEMEEFLPFPVHKHVKGAVLYKDSPSSLTLPHLAGEWKGRGKDMDEARLRSAYDGAALVYGRNQALSYLGQSDPPGHAEVITFTTDGTNINFYAHYVSPSEEGTLEYHQYQYASANVKDSYQGHKDGRKGSQKPTRPCQGTVVRLEEPAEGALERTF
jgi:hypothetical protein